LREKDSALPGKNPGSAYGAGSHDLIKQRVAGNRTDERKRKTTELATRTILSDDQLMTADRIKPLLTGNVRRAFAAIYKILGSCTLQASMDCRSKFVLDSPRDIQPAYLLLAALGIYSEDGSGHDGHPV